MSEKTTHSIESEARKRKKNVYNEPSNAIELKYLHIPIECNVLANRDDKEVFFPSSLSVSYFSAIVHKWNGHLMRLACNG